MKVTAIIPDDLVKEVQSISNAKNITEAMIIALDTYVYISKLKSITEKLSANPLQLNYTAEEIRNLNRT